jgi:hypothetical protein
MTERTLRELFEPFGTVSEVKLIMDHETGQPCDDAAAHAARLAPKEQPFEKKGVVPGSGAITPKFAGGGAS